MDYYNTQPEYTTISKPIEYVGAWTTTISKTIEYVGTWTTTILKRIEYMSTGLLEYPSV